MQTPPPGSSPSNYPRPGINVDRQALREVAVAQRQVMYCVLGQIGIGVLNVTIGAAKMPALGIVVLLLALGLLVYMIVSVLKLAKALDLSQALYAVLMIIPCVSLLVLLSLSGKATERLKQAGIKVGLLGADPNSI